MSNTIEVTGAVKSTMDVTVSRAGKGKNAATKTRTMVGVLVSGNKEEREAFAGLALWDLWERHQYGAIMVEVGRVYPKWGAWLKDRNELVLGELAADPECKLRVVDPGEVGKRKQATLAAMALCAKRAGLKGEAEKMATVFSAVCAREKEEEQRRKAAEQAPQRAAIAA